MQSQSLWKPVWCFLKLNLLLSYDPAIAPHVILPRVVKNLHTLKNLYIDVNNFIHNYQNLEVIIQ